MLSVQVLRHQHGQLRAPCAAPVAAYSEQLHGDTAIDIVLYVVEHQRTRIVVADDGNLQRIVALGEDAQVGALVAGL